MAGTEIRSITARQVYTNRGNPGVEAVVTTENGATGRAMCTSGISIGTHEIHFDFDGGERFRGKGVLGAVRNVNEIIAPALKGLDALMVPVGGFYTIDAGQAKALVDQLQPRVTIPMHYRSETFGYDVIGPLEDYLALCQNVVRYPDNVLVLDRDTPAQTAVLTYCPQ